MGMCSCLFWLPSSDLPSSKCTAFCKPFFLPSVYQHTASGIVFPVDSESVLLPSLVTAKKSLCLGQQDVFFVSFCFFLSPFFFSPLNTEDFNLKEDGKIFFDSFSSAIFMEAWCSRVKGLGGGKSIGVLGEHFSSYAVLWPEREDIP